MRSDEEFNQRIQHIGRGLENLAERINMLRQTARGRVQLMRGVVRPAVDKLVAAQPRPPGSVRTPPQPERAEAQRPGPIFPILGLIPAKPEVAEAPQAEPQERPAEIEEKRRYPPERPALY